MKPVQILILIIGLSTFLFSEESSFKAFLQQVTMRDGLTKAITQVDRFHNFSIVETTDGVEIEVWNNYMSGNSREVYTFPATPETAQELFRYQQYQKLQEILILTDSSEAQYRIGKFFQNDFKKGRTTYKEVLKVVGEEFRSVGEFQQFGSFNLVSKDHTILIRETVLEDVQPHSDSLFYKDLTPTIYIEDGEYFLKHRIERLIEERKKSQQKVSSSPGTH